MWIEILKFCGFGLFWFSLSFIAILLSTSYDVAPTTLRNNYLLFIGVPLLLLVGYEIYTIYTNQLSWQNELLRFLFIVVVPLILATLYIKYGK